MTLWDKVIVLLATLSGIFLLLSGFYHKTQSANYATVWFCDKKIGDFDLKRNLLIPLKEGIVIELKDKKIRILKNTCPQKICIHQGWISTPGSTIICIPNKLVVSISGENKKYDALSQ